MRTITISITKEIQEDVHEPFSLTMATTIDVPKQLTRKEIEELYDFEYAALVNQQNSILEKRIQQG